jgi:hypothetical protein
MLLKSWAWGTHVWKIVRLHEDLHEVRHAPRCVADHEHLEIREGGFDLFSLLQI